MLSLLYCGRGGFGAAVAVVNVNVFCCYSFCGLQLWSLPLQLVVALALLTHLLGRAAVAGVVVGACWFPPRRVVLGT